MNTRCIELISPCFDVKYLNRYPPRAIDIQICLFMLLCECVELLLKINKIDELCRKRSSYLKLYHQIFNISHIFGVA